VPEFGVERKLIAFIEDAGKPVDKTTWFTFDRLEFETGSANLKPSSMEQLKNIAEILKASAPTRSRTTDPSKTTGGRTLPTHPFLSTPDVCAGFEWIPVPWWIY
jgi:hypothetical protein